MLKGKCERCNLENAILLHHVYIKSSYIRVCTACVLSLHPGTFCTICFQVFENLTPSNSQNCVKCKRCPSTSHFTCIPSSSSPSSSSFASTFSQEGSNYLCPSCSDPTFVFFKHQRDARTNEVAIDDYLSRQMLAAASISHYSISKAALLTKIKAEIRARESAAAQKAAKEALDKLADLTMPSNYEAEDEVDVHGSNHGGSQEAMEDDESDDGPNHGGSQEAMEDDESDDGSKGGFQHVLDVDSGDECENVSLDEFQIALEDASSFESSSSDGQE